MNMNRNIDGLRNHLFAQLERLGEEDLKGDGLKEEIHRGKAISDISASIIDAAKAEFRYLELTESERGSRFIETDDRPALPGDTE
ncbi:hypothetical protein [Halomonas piscis]|uniref:hypothetical protein n=1 Tax=Halomonas piscis TaxID=3031727 RepID=UPI0028A0FBE9|nr:hypothetical protein [Halomonas piscis]